MKLKTFINDTHFFKSKVCELHAAQYLKLVKENVFLCT